MCTHSLFYFIFIYIINQLSSFSLTLQPICKSVAKTPSLLVDCVAKYTPANVSAASFRYAIQFPRTLSKNIRQIMKNGKSIPPSTSRENANMSSIPSVFSDLAYSGTPSLSNKAAIKIIKLENRNYSGSTRT